MSKDSLGDRMKAYEGAYRNSLPGRMPVIIRIDGKAFHTYTETCERPWDQKLIDVMNETAMYLCKNVQNCCVAYVQSDEISLLLNNFKTIETQSWFDNNVQKMVSISSAMASAIFTANSWKIFGDSPNEPSAENIVPAMFDSRVFVLPKEDVNNYFLWRQQDATRNSVQTLARSLYSHKECNNKNNSELQEMCFKKGKNWNDVQTAQKRGRCIIKTTHMQGSAERSKWIVDNEIPVFSSDIDYINKYLAVEEVKPKVLTKEMIANMSPEERKKLAESMWNPVKICGGHLTPKERNDIRRKANPNWSDAEMIRQGLLEKE